MLLTTRHSEPIVVSEGSQPLLSRRELLGMSVLWFALNFQFAALLPIVVPAQILLLVTPGTAGTPQQALFLGGLAALGAVTAVVLQPLVGALSDRTATRLGRRRPYILGGGFLMLIGLTLLAASHMIALYVLGLFLVVVANTVSGTAYQGLVPDKVPDKQRGAASGYMGLMTILGTVGSLAVASTLLSQTSGLHASVAGALHGASLFYLVAAVILVVSVVLTAVRGARGAASVQGASSRPRWSLRQQSFSDPQTGPAPPLRPDVGLPLAPRQLHMGVSHARVCDAGSGPLHDIH